MTELVVTGRVEELREDDAGWEVEDPEVLEVPLEVVLKVVVDLALVLVLLLAVEEVDFVLLVGVRVEDFEELEDFAVVDVDLKEEVEDFNELAVETDWLVEME